MSLGLSSVNTAPQLLQTAALIANVDNGDKGYAGIRPEKAAEGKTGKESETGTEAPASEKISLSSTNDATIASSIPAAPYAEIWKDGRKIATVDVRGEISTVNGFAGTVSLGGGHSSAALKAALFARTVGGEIRVAGMVADASTLTMRAKLHAAYGS